MARLFLSVVFLLMLATLSQGVPQNPKKVKCKDKENFPACHQTDLHCPAACPHTCYADCSSCQAVCHPPPPPPHKPHKVKCRDHSYRNTCRHDLFCPAACPKKCAVDCAKCQTVCSLPPPVHSLPPPPANTPSSVPSPPPDRSEAGRRRRVRCRNRLYPSCYYREHRCPAACPGSCEVDCVTCSPVCSCNRPGAVCQDPRFIGADGLTFYFHGQKDKDFCLVSDSNLHINGHFIGKRNQNMGRDFTWVQSLGILFGSHQILIGAKRTAIWDDNVDRLKLSFDGQPIPLPEREGAKWELNLSSNVVVKRTRDTNAITVKIEGNFRITASVVPISEEESIVHKYGITSEDCFAHLDLGFKFYSLSDDVSGVLGQTYAKGYVSRVKMGVDMPVLGGGKEFATSGLFSTDCAVARFNGTRLGGFNDLQENVGLGGRADSTSIK